MKKFVFCAVALVSFSFAGMASTGEKKIELKEIKKEVKISKIEESKALPELTCRAAKFQAYVDSRAAGFSHAESSGNSYGVYFACLGW